MCCRGNWRARFPELTAVAENISRGNFDRKIVGTERRDEIGALARAIERMAASIKLAFERLRKKPLNLHDRRAIGVCGWGGPFLRN
ncbi:MAG: HAMP domain-containing protein [Candidatus Competibacteraceae bacterium]|nr:MAG: HAMP domain-containing protein [Candidatus Competibacteraceae bacterium]